MAHFITRRDLLRGILLTGAAGFLAACKAPTTQLSGTLTPHTAITPARQPMQTFTPRPTGTYTITPPATSSPTPTPNPIETLVVVVRAEVAKSDGLIQMLTNPDGTFQIQAKEKFPTPIPTWDNTDTKTPEPSADYRQSAVIIEKDGSASFPVKNVYDGITQRVNLAAQDITPAWDTDRNELTLNGGKYAFNQYLGIWTSTEVHAGCTEKLC